MTELGAKVDLTKSIPTPPKSMPYPTLEEGFKIPDPVHGDLSMTSSVVGSVNELSG